MNDHRSGADPSDEFPKFAAWPKVSPGFQAMLKASSDAAVRPVFAELSKKLLGAGLSKPYLGEFSKLAVGPKVSPGFQAMLKASSDAAVRPVFAELSAGMQAVLQAHTQAVARPVFAELSKTLLGAGLSKPYLGEVTKLAAWQNMRAAIDVPAGRTLSERARFSDLLGQVGELSPAGTDGQATLADLAQLQAERRVAHEADQAILDLRDQFEQLVTIMQAVQQHQETEAQASRRLQVAALVATLAATILLALLPYLFPPRSTTTPPNPTAPPSSVTVPPGEPSTTRQVPSRPSRPQRPRGE